MNRFIFVLCALILCFTTLFSQSWKNEIELSTWGLSVGSDDNLDIFSNRQGNHYILHLNNQLYYRLYAYDGELIRYTTIDNFSENPRLSRITGYNDKVYVVYKKGGYIYTKKSINAGQSWSSITPRTMNYSTSNGLELSADETGVHMSWSERYGTPNHYETNYSFLQHDNTVWTDFKQVTDYSGDEGGLPTIVASPNRVYVGYAERPTSDPFDGYSGETRLRIKDNGTWQTPENVNTEYGVCYQLNLAVSSSLLHKFSYIPGDVVSGGPNDYEIFSQYRSRQLNSGSFSYAPSPFATDVEDMSYNSRIDITKTPNNHLHMVYKGDAIDSKYIEWNDGLSSSVACGRISTRITSSGNDIYVGYIKNNHLYLRQRDYAPMIPANFSATVENQHPKVTWNANEEADLANYEVWKKKNNGSWYLQTTTTNIYYTDTGETICWQDYAYYKIRAADENDNKSAFTNYVMFTVFGKRAMDDDIVLKNDIPDSYQMSQNYPNPFNPSTTIRFGLPKAENVLLQVYNVSGQLVATLVNGYLEAGYHNIDFNGHQLSSGIYLYKLTTDNFTKVKRMLIVK